MSTSLQATFKDLWPEESILAQINDQIGQSERKLNELIVANQTEIAKLKEDITHLKDQFSLADKAITELEDLTRYRREIQNYLSIDCQERNYQQSLAS